MKKPKNGINNQLKAAEAIIAAIGDGLSIQDTGFRILYQNQIQKDLMGDHVGEYCYRAYERKEQVCEGCPLALTFADGLLHKAERANFTKEEVFYVDITASPIIDATGRIIAGIEIVRDISERKKAELSIKESQSQMEAILNAFEGFLYVCSADYRIEFMNARLIERTGHDATGELCYKALQDLDAPCPWRRNEQVFKGETVRWEVQSPKDNRWYYVGNSPVFHADGTVSKLSIILDITDRKLAEKELAAEKERLEVTLGSIGDAVIATDTAGAIVLMNKVAEDLTGWSRQEATGRPLTEVLHVIDEITRTPCENPVEKMFERGANVCLDSLTVLVARDGTERLIADSGSPIRDETNQIIGTVLVFRDITEKRKIAEELLNAKKLEAVAILSAGIAHEINNPLTNASLKIQLMKEKSAGDRYLAENLDAVERSIDKASTIAKELLDFSRQRKLEFVPLNIIAVIDSALASLAHKLDGIAVTRETADISEIYGDPLKLEQVFINIFTNAIEAMPRGGEISISVSQSGGMVKVRIVDTGKGIAHGQMPKAFDPFYTTKEVGAGAGLGLSICYGIIMQHRGSIEISGAERRGTVVTIMLPTGRSVL